MSRPRDLRDPRDLRASHRSGPRSMEPGARGGARHHSAPGDGAPSATPPPAKPCAAPAAPGDLGTGCALRHALLGGPRPLLLAIGASWCAPYRALAPLLDRTARDRGATLDVASLDVDQQADLIEHLEITSVPTLLLLRDGVERGRRRGAVTGAELCRWLDELLVDPPS